MESIFEFFSPFNFFSLFFLVGIFLVLANSLFAQLRGQAVNWTDILTNMKVLIGAELLHIFVFSSISYTGLVFFETYSQFSVKPTILNWLCCFVFVDFAYYWRHRCEHQMPLLWLAHSTHHSSKELNWSTGLRVPWFIVPISWIFFIPLIFLGFPAFMVSICFTINLLYQVIIHHPTIPKIPFVETILNTPSHHRVHHGEKQENFASNFGGFFIIWDRFFGTFNEEKKQITYGAGFHLTSNNPLVINIWPFYLKLRTVISLKNRTG